MAQSVKIFTKRNPVYYSAQEAWERYGAHLDGLLSGPVGAVSNKPLGETARNALIASAERLGYGDGAVTFITLTPENVTLSGAQARGIIEAVDPMVLIATDANAMSLLSRAYNAEFSARRPARLLGRTAIGFVDFEKMLGENATKQQAWAQLKTLGEKPKPR